MAGNTHVYFTNGINSNMQSTIGTNGINMVNGVNGDYGLADHAHHANRETAVETPVLIIGGGPTGLLLAHLLSRLGSQDFECLIF
jgi:cation diffusion facilitator CzcD-associated flavoprotein CzcO